MAMPSYHETGAIDLDLEILKKAVLYFNPGFKMSAIREYNLKKACITVGPYVGWVGYIPVSNPRHYGKLRNRRTFYDSYNLVGYKGMDNQLSLGCEAQIVLCNSLAVSLNAEYNLLSRFQIGQANAKIEWSF